MASGSSTAVTGRYRTTPLRALWQHGPYFHDGSAATLEEVVEHYDGVRGLRLTAAVELWRTTGDTGVGDWFVRNAGGALDAIGSGDLLDHQLSQGRAGRRDRGCAQWILQP